MNRRLILILALGAGPSMAQEGRVDLFGTNLSGNDASLSIQRQSLFGGSTSAAADIDPGASPEAGVRAMIQSDESPLFGGAELSHFSTNGTELNLSVTQVALLGGVRLRQPLLAHRGDGLHPYVLIGISGASMKGHAELGTLYADISTGGNLLASSAPVISFVAAAGIEWQLSERLGLVAEYRDRHYDIEGFSTDSWILPTENTTASGRLDASGLGLGISWRFAAPGKARMPASQPEPPAP